MDKFRLGKIIWLVVKYLIITRPKPAYGRQGLDWIVRGDPTDL